MERSGCLNADEYALARGVSLGLFVGFTPTVGVQSVIMMFGSLLFRANFPAALVASLVSNPLTVAPLYFAFHRTGQWLLAGSSPVVEAATRSAGLAGLNAAALALGSLAIALPSAVVGYVAFLALWRALDVPVRRRQTRRRTDRARRLS
nr:DUF2062 domain-containing protein [Wenzhouxiangella sp. XN79A]